MEQEIVKLSGVVEDITFRRQENGFTVFDMSSDGELITVVGVMPELSPGEEIKVSGHWDFHPSFGRQFRAELCERSMPATSSAMLKYLSSGVIKGVRSATAEKIVSAFGDKTFEILENSPERLAELPGISRDKAKSIGEEFRKQFAVRQVMIYLERYGMTASECLKVFSALGVCAIEKINENPYILCREDIKISFDRADDIAAKLENPVDSSFRTDAGVLYVLKHNLDNGHTCIPRDKLIEPSSMLLEADPDSVQAAIDRLVVSKELVCCKLGEREFLFLPSAYRAEMNISRRLDVLLKFPPAGKTGVQKDITKVEIEKGITFADKQRLAIATAIERGILVLTGGPGTGKTTTLNGILSLYEKDGLDVVLAAPTGRAAKRMSEVTGREAKTIHRLLEVKWEEGERKTFARNITNPIEADALIVDELSMVDIYLFSALLEALPLGCRLVLVGDSDQLPPVGAGNVLHDIIKSGLLPVVELKEVFRQAMESLIVTNAHKIVKGEMPILNSVDSDFFYMERRNPVSAAQTVAQLCAERLPKAYGYRPFEDIQILCPSKMGELGTNNLNRMLQERLNPPEKFKEELQSGGRVLREGDKVMQTKNNYDIPWEKAGESGMGIFNGDIGVIKTINMAGGYIEIDFDDRQAVYSLESASELELAYAITVHKSQGSEFEAVIMPVYGAPPRLSYRNLLYTAVTRAKKIIVLVGLASQIEAMVNNDKKTKRFSALDHFLTGDYEV